MNEEKEPASDLERVHELHDFLQGITPKGYVIPPEDIPNLTEEQAWTVVWYIQNLYWQVPDNIGRCDVCGVLYDTDSEGDCLDYSDVPYHFCEGCMAGEEYAAKYKDEDA